MLRIVGEAPVDSLSVELYQAQEAIDVLDDITTEVLSEGWSFNTDTNLKLSPNLSGEIIKPENAISIDVSQKEGDYMYYTERNGKLYDTKNHTFQINRTIHVDIVWFYDFDTLPEPARKYIKMKACRRYHLIKLGAQDINQYNIEAERMAYADLQSYDMKSSDVNIMNDSDVAYIALRHWGGYYN